MSKEQSFKLLDAFYEAGGNFIDTANNYQNEQSEKWIGEWMTTKKNRDLMVIATEYTTGYRTYELGAGKTVNYSGNHKKSLHLSVNDSLKKLQTDYIDLLYVHWWDWTTSIEEVMDSLHILVEQGKVLYLGISDTPAWIVSAANTYARCHDTSAWPSAPGMSLEVANSSRRSKSRLARRQAKASAACSPASSPRRKRRSVQRSKKSPASTGWRACRRSRSPTSCRKRPTFTPSSVVGRSNICMTTSRPSVSS